MRAYVIEEGSTSLTGLKQVERDDPVCGPRDVVFRIRATSINARDQAIIVGRYRVGTLTRATVPLSDGAGDVIAVGADVTRFEVGDRVMPIFVPNWLDGPYRAEYRGNTLGVPNDGMLCELAAADEANLVHVPEHLGFEEAATLPCAAVTAWHALMEKQSIKPGETALLIGTGGVAIFGLQFAKMAGARAIVISSSDAKLARARALGADGTVNYKTTPEWDAAVRELTGGRGVDHVVEVGGETLPRSIAALAFGGHIHAIGFVSGREPTFNAPDFVLHDATLDSIMVGSRAMFERMNAAIAANGLKPVVDRVFPFEEARAAYEYQASSELFGKVVITV